MSNIKYPKLKIISEPNKGAVFVLKKRKYSCGRSELNDIVLDDVAISAKHCELLQDNDKYLVRDAGSTNGTMVNNVLIGEEQNLKNSDIIISSRIVLL